MEWLDFILIAGAFVFAAVVGWYAWWRPLRRLQALAERLAAGETPKTSFLDSPRWYRGLERDLERISRRMREMGQSLAEEKFNLSAIVTSMSEGVLVVDTRHVIRLVNEEVITLFGLKQNPIHRTVLEALREADLELILRETFQSGHPVEREMELLVLSPDNKKPLQVEISSVPIRNEGGEVQGVVLVIHDVSQVKHLEGIRKEFIANVSHELRTPLSIFRGYLETLVDNPDLPKEEVQRIYETMRRHSNRLNALVEDLLTLSRLESRRELINPVMMQIDVFIAQVLRDYKTKLEAEQAEIVVKVEPNLPPIEVDRLKMEQVLFNLLDNSIVYSKPPKRIEIEARRMDKHLVLSVRDNGMGIPPADLPRIFERFYRVDKARSRERGGTGLGLAIVKHIAQMHGGSVAAESEFGHWTKISLQLPLHSENGIK